jgi:hypothetical protein
VDVARFVGAAIAVVCTFVGDDAVRELGESVSTAKVVAGVGVAAAGVAAPCAAVVVSSSKSDMKDD